MLATPQLALQSPVVAARATDPARTLDEERRGDRQRSATAVELPSLLWRAQFSEPPLAGFHIQGPKQRPHTDGADHLAKSRKKSQLTGVRVGSTVLDMGAFRNLGRGVF
ncbi:MAG: hypothetical protein HYY76_18070 [Acidobacteria bacterium]|nr:hypothetical protein [Acidobacteriota bacterium]